MPYVDLPHARIHYDTAGEAGTGVLLIMGFGVPGRMWLNQIPVLSARHRVAWFDNAGAGETQRRSRGRHTIARMAADAIAVIDQLELADAHVVGVSMGGMIAQELALRHRGRVRSLSLVVTHPGGLRHLVPPLASLLLFASGFLGPRRLRARALERLIFPDDYLRSVNAELLRAALRDDVVAAAPRGDRLRQISAVLGHRTAHRLHNLADTPTLVVKAARDRLIRPAASDQLHACIPGSRLVDFADAGHAILHQCAERLNRELLDHFERVDRRVDRRSADSSRLTQSPSWSLLRK